MLLRADTESVQNGLGDPDAGNIVIFDSLYFTDIVEKQDQIEEQWVIVLTQFLFVASIFFVVFGKNAIEVADRTKNMCIGGVTVVVFVLHHAGQRTKLWEVSPEHAEFVHL